MTQIFSSLFGGGGVGAKKAQKQMEQSQAVTNDRQLAEVQRQSAVLDAGTRRAPRGQRLFSDGPASTSRKLGG